MNIVKNMISGTCFSSLVVKSAGQLEFAQSAELRAQGNKFCSEQRCAGQVEFAQSKWQRAQGKVEFAQSAELRAQGS